MKFSKRQTTKLECNECRLTTKCWRTVGNVVRERERELNARKDRKRRTSERTKQERERERETSDSWNLPVLQAGGTARQMGCRNRVEIKSTCRAQWNKIETKNKKRKKLKSSQKVIGSSETLSYSNKYWENRTKT